jgi:hypothetical protein
MSFLFFIHLVILVAIVSVPVWPKNYLAYGLFLPTIMTMLWVLCGDCPLTQMQSDLDGQTFEQVVMRSIFDDITDKQIYHLSAFAMSAITLVAAIRLRG